MNDFDYQQLTLNLYSLEDSHWKLLDTKTLEKSKTPITFKCLETDQQCSVYSLNEYKEEIESDNTVAIFVNQIEIFNVSQYGFNGDNGMTYGCGKYLLKELNHEQCVFQVSNGIELPDIEMIDIYQSHKTSQELGENEFYFMITITFQ